MLKNIIKSLDSVLDEWIDLISSQNEAKSIDDWTRAGYYVVYETETDYYTYKGRENYEETEVIISVWDNYDEARNAARYSFFGQHSIACP